MYINVLWNIYRHHQTNYKKIYIEKSKICNSFKY